jgi:hypothetical protein
VFDRISINFSHYKSELTLNVTFNAFIKNYNSYRHLTTSFTRYLEINKWCSKKYLEVSRCHLAKTRGLSVVRFDEKKEQAVLDFLSELKKLKGI